MESSSLSAKASEPPSHRWASIIGTTIAVLTLTLPLVFIAAYSSPDSVTPLPQSRYSLYNSTH